MRPAHLLVTASAVLVSLSVLSACGKDDDPASGKASAIKVTATDSSCDVGTKSGAAGATTFKVTNKGSQVNELEILAPDGKIVSERENIGPGTGAEITVTLSAGTYKVLCSAGMTGRGPSQTFTVTGQGKAADPRLDAAVAAYRVYIGRQVDDTLAKTRQFAAAVKKGDIAGAKAGFAPSRFGWESIEPVAESFGDIDPKVDAREADLKPGDKWTGWHQIEKALWKTKSLKGEGPYADDLVKELGVLKQRVGTASITATSMATGATALLDALAAGKLTGEEDTFSHTDLSDYKANVDGAQKKNEQHKPDKQEHNAALTGDLTDEFAKVQKLLTKYEKGNGYVSYDAVGKAKRKELSDEVNALGEPLSKLAGVVAK